MEAKWRPNLELIGVPGKPELLDRLLAPARARMAKALRHRRSVGDWRRLEYEI
jgi:hypothetical protein